MNGDSLHWNNRNCLKCRFLRVALRRKVIKLMDGCERGIFSSDFCPEVVKIKLGTNLMGRGMRAARITGTNRGLVFFQRLKEINKLADLIPLLVARSLATGTRVRPC